MAGSGWSNLGAKKLDLGKGGGGGIGGALGGRGTEILLVVALGVIILGSLILAVYSIFGSEGPKGDSQDNVMHFQCEKCQAEFTRTFKELTQSNPQMVLPEFGMLQTDCPKCGAKKSAYVMVKCPNCAKFYVSDSTKLFAMTQPSNQVRQVKDICPFCKTDRVEWYRAHYKKQD